MEPTFYALPSFEADPPARIGRLAQAVFLQRLAAEFDQHLHRAKRKGTYDGDKT